MKKSLLSLQEPEIQAVKYERNPHSSNNVINCHKILQEGNKC